MTVQFNKLKSSTLSLFDTIPFGKFKNCRVVDIIEEDYESILYLQSKSKFFSEEVVNVANKYKEAAEKIINYENEIKPYLKDDFEDIPF